MNSAEKQTVLHCLKSMIDEASCEECPLYGMTGTDHCEKDCVRLALNALEQQPCEMTVGEYRQRMIQAFHNADCDELIALVVLPTEKEFEHLGWLLEKHYKAKPEPCSDTISRQAAIDACLNGWNKDYKEIVEEIRVLPPVKPAELEQETCGNPHIYECSCGYGWDRRTMWRDFFCPNCGKKVQEVEE